jgi:hypothetical protein
MSNTNSHVVYLKAMKQIVFSGTEDECMLYLSYYKDNLPLDTDVYIRQYYELFLQD